MSPALTSALRVLANHTRKRSLGVIHQPWALLRLLYCEKVSSQKGQLLELYLDMSPGLCGLPAELLPWIVSSLSTHDLSRVVLTCSKLRAEVHAAWPNIRKRRFPMSKEDFADLASRLRDEAKSRRAAAQYYDHADHTARLEAETVARFLANRSAPEVCSMRKSIWSESSCRTEGSVAPPEDDEDELDFVLCARCAAHMVVESTPHSYRQWANALEARAEELQGAGLDEHLPASVLRPGGDTLARDLLWQIASRDQDADERIAAFLEAIALLKRDWPSCVRFHSAYTEIGPLMPLMRFQQLRELEFAPPPEVALFIALDFRLSGISWMNLPDAEQPDPRRFLWVLGSEAHEGGNAALSASVWDECEGGSAQFPTCCCEAGGATVHDFESWVCVSNARACLHIGHATENEDVPNDLDGAARLYVCCERQSRHWGQVLSVDPLARSEHLQWSSFSPGGLTALIKRIHAKLHHVACNVLYNKFPSARVPRDLMESLIGPYPFQDGRRRLDDVPRHKLPRMPYRRICKAACLWDILMGVRKYLEFGDLGPVEY